jgi:TRAP-type C4-dicarboxylate transport system permease small subunit
VVNTITSLLGAIVCLIITAYGVKVTWDYMQMGYLYYGSLVIPAYLFAAVIPLGGFLLFIQFLKRTYSYLGKLRAPQ